jgi:hypothetical protein
VIDPFADDALAHRREVYESEKSSPEEKRLLSFYTEGTNELEWNVVLTFRRSRIPRRIQ